MAECVHFLELAIAIQNERDPATRLQLLRELPTDAREPVLAWLWAHATRPQTSASSDLRETLAKVRTA